MKMNEFMTALQTYLATQQQNYSDHAESILEVVELLRTILKKAMIQVAYSLISSHVIF